MPSLSYFLSHLLLLSLAVPSTYGQTLNQIKAPTVASSSTSSSASAKVTTLNKIKAPSAPSSAPKALSCSQPTILLPTGNKTDVTVSTRQPIISGTSDCPYVTIQLTSRPPITVSVISGKFSFQPKPLADGRYAISTAGSLDSAGTNKGPGIARTMEVKSAEALTCDRPVILLPTGNATDVTVSTRRPFITGTTDCPFVTIQITTRAVVTVSVNSGQFSYQPSALANGRYAISVKAIGNEQGANAGLGIARTMSVESTERMKRTQVAVQRRVALSRTRCMDGEEMCRTSVGISNQKSFEYGCFSDLSTNSERCGSCAGPDCTALLNVNDVSCEAGQCQIISCASGYTLLDNACLVDLA